MIDNAIVIYSRNGSNRLPGKALRKIGHYYLLEFIIKRLYILESFSDFKIIVATTYKSEDDSIVDLAKELDVLCFRGHEHNLINRTLELIDKFQVKKICRVNGDCPFVDDKLILHAYHELMRDKQLVSNIIRRTYPYGISVEWFDTFMFKSLEYLALNNELEHVTKHLYRHLNKITYKSLESEIDYSMFKFTVDTYEDLDKISTLLNQYEKENQVKIKFKELIK